MIGMLTSGKLIRQMPLITEQKNLIVRLLNKNVFEYLLTVGCPITTMSEFALFNTTCP